MDNSDPSQVYIPQNAIDIFPTELDIGANKLRPNTDGSFIIPVGYPLVIINVSMNATELTSVLVLSSGLITVNVEVVSLDEPGLDAQNVSKYYTTLLVLILLTEEIVVQLTFCLCIMVLYAFK